MTPKSIVSIILNFNLSVNKFAKNVSCQCKKKLRKTHVPCIFIIELTHIPQPKYLETNAINFHNNSSSLKVYRYRSNKEMHL